MLTPDEILQYIDKNFTTGRKRKFLPGLLIAFIEFLRALGATGGKYTSLDEFYKDFPEATERAGGGGVNTFTVKIKVTHPTTKKVRETTASIRPHYNAIADWFRSNQKRFDYPSSAPHATQAWVDYKDWIEAILSYDDATLDALVARTKLYVLEHLPAQDIDPDTVRREPPVFLLFLQDFDLAKQAGETSGAAYQGTVFGYIRADAPHLQVEVGKVRTGSKREKRVGDIDARDGDSLVLSAEVKQFVLATKDLPDLAEFSQLIAKHKALGLVVALDFESGVAEELEKMGLAPIAKSDLIERVRIWDPLKQRIAMNAVLYYVGFREQNSALYERIKTFLEAAQAASQAT